MILGLVLVAATVVPDAVPAKSVEADSVTIVRGAAGKQSLVVAVHARSRDTADLVGERAKAAWALGNRVVVIQELSMVMGNAAVFVPRSCYADLLDVSAVELRPRRGGAQVILRGGDGANSFEAYLEIDDFRVRSRRVVGFEEPGRPTEETTYHRRVVKDVP